METANHFLRSEDNAAQIVERLISTIGKNWSAVREEAGLLDQDPALLWGRRILNPFAFEDLNAEYACLAGLASDSRKLNGWSWQLRL
ncbi:MAG: hypothetical protein GY866_09585 [Proteobacteria bacterium]|nr:hypothetical protein [Pseudomonadota bacterium]